MEKSERRSTLSTKPEVLIPSCKPSLPSDNLQNSITTINSTTTKKPKKFSIPQSSFKSILTSLSPSHNWHKTAIESLHYAAEAYLESLFSDSNLILTHCNRRTLYIKDMTLARRIRGL